MGVNKIIVSVGVISLLAGIVSRLMVSPLPPVGLEANALLQFANSCFLLAIATSLAKK
jgi:hypothetical protein